MAVVPTPGRHRSTEPFKILPEVRSVLGHAGASGARVAATIGVACGLVVTGTALSAQAAPMSPMPAATPVEAAPASALRSAPAKAYLTTTLRKGNPYRTQNKVLQRRLNALGPSLAVDGSFGPKTLAAVKRYQRSKGLQVDGVVGPHTRKSLGLSAPAARRSSGKAVNVARAAMWDRIAKCESGGRWNINTGNGYYGGLQFDYATWLGANGNDFASRADRATRAEQITVANRLYAKRGLQPWGCRSAA